MTRPIIGIRCEDKNPSERRAPLTPRHVAALVSRQVEVHVQPSENRIFKMSDYLAAGAISSELSTCPVIFGVKEVPIPVFEEGKTYVFFSHTIKGQAYNLPMLRRMINKRVSLIDYECIVDDSGKRLVFFSRHAGLAGMVESLVALGKRLSLDGFTTPLNQLSHAKDHDDLDSIKDEVRRVGKAWKQMPTALPNGPLICGFLGSGNVTLGAHEIFGLLDPVILSPEELLETYDELDSSGRTLYQVTFSRRHLAKRRDGTGPFDVEEYDEYPDRYESAFSPYLPLLTLLINGITWREEYPIFVPKELLQELYEADNPRLKVVGDITCDIKGSIACTVRPTTLSNPCYVWDPKTLETTDGISTKGLVVMAVDNLPASLPLEASRSFGDALSPFVEEIARTSFDAPFESLTLPDPIRRALVLHRGVFPPDFAPMQEYL